MKFVDIEWKTDEKRDGDQNEIHSPHADRYSGHKCMDFVNWMRDTFLVTPEK